MILVYTFRTFPWIDELEESFTTLPLRCPYKLFVFGKLREDLKSFHEIIEAEKPEWIMGIAKGRRSAWENLAINNFHKGKIIKGGVEEYQLFIPEKSPFPIHQITGTTFCNWTAYKIKDFLVKESIDTKLSFIHVNKEGLDDLKTLIIV